MFSQSYFKTFTFFIQITIEADIGESMQRWMALDDFRFSVIGDEECVILPPEADPNPPSTSTTTTVKPWEGIHSYKLSKVENQ